MSNATDGISRIPDLEAEIQSLNRLNEIQNDRIKAQEEVLERYRRSPSVVIAFAAAVEEMIDSKLEGIYRRLDDLEEDEQTTMDLNSTIFEDKVKEIVSYMDFELADATVEVR